MKMWEHFEHEADIGVRGLGTTAAEAFEQAAVAMTAVIADPSLIEPERLIEVTAEGHDSEMLLVDWLNAILFEMARRNMLFAKFKVEFKNGLLRGSLWGEAVVPEKHQPAVEVKGASYGGLRVFQRNDGIWQAECIVDV